MPVNLNQLCILALFFKDEQKTNDYCYRLVQTNTLLPMGTYLTQGLWVIGTKEKIDFSIVCLGISGRKSIKTLTTQSIDPPLGIIQLEPGCHAANNFLSLPPYYFFEEQIDVPDPYRELLELHNMTEFKLWEPFSQALPNFSKLELPTNLSIIKQIPMDDLILKLRGMRRVEIRDTSWPLWAYIVIDSVVCIAIAGIVFLYLRYRKHKKPLDFEKHGCCARLAMFCGDRGEVDGDEPHDQPTSVSYSKETDEVTILQGRAQSAPPNEDVGRNPFIQQLYPGLPTVAH